MGGRAAGVGGAHVGAPGPQPFPSGASTTPPPPRGRQESVVHGPIASWLQPRLLPFTSRRRVMAPSHWDRRCPGSRQVGPGVVEAGTPVTADRGNRPRTGGSLFENKPRPVNSGPGPSTVPLPAPPARDPHRPASEHSPRLQLQEGPAMGCC